MISQCIQQMTMKILKENPNIANNPNAQSMINVIQSGDEKKGQEIAENICKSMGVSKEDAIRQAEQMKLRFGYMDQNEPKMMNKPVSTYGAAYDSWSDARKHYTKTGSSEDKERMEERGKEHVEKAIISMRDIWSEASPELKRAMKTELSTLVDNMTI